MGDELGDELGEDDGFPECVFVGKTVGVTVTDGVAVGDGELLGDVVDDEVGDGLIAVPTCAGGGKLSTGAPWSAAFIICCHVNAGRPAP